MSRRASGRTRRSAGWGAQGGLALTEFALVLPLLLLLVFGAVGFGIAILDKVVITNASREAARHGSVYRGSSLRPSAAQVQAVATSYCTQNLIDFGGGRNCTVTLSADPSTLASGGSLTVTVSHSFTFLGLAGFINPFGASNGIQLSAATTMRVE